MGFNNNNQEKDLRGKIAQLQQKLLRLAPHPSAANAGTSNGKISANDADAQPHITRPMRGKGSFALGSQNVIHNKFNEEAVQRKAVLNAYFNDLPERETIQKQITTLMAALGSRNYNAPAQPTQLELAA